MFAGILLDDGCSLDSGRDQSLGEWFDSLPPGICCNVSLIVFRLLGRYTSVGGNLSALEGFQFGKIFGRTSTKGHFTMNICP